MLGVEWIWDNATYHSLFCLVVFVVKDSVGVIHGRTGFLCLSLRFLKALLWGVVSM